MTRVPAHEANQVNAPTQKLNCKSLLPTCGEGLTSPPPPIASHSERAGRSWNQSPTHINTPKGTKGTR